MKILIIIILEHTPSKVSKVINVLNVCCFFLQDTHSTKSKHQFVISLQSGQQKSSPLGLTATRLASSKPTFFESRTCKELMTDKFSRVSSGWGIMCCMLSTFHVSSQIMATISESSLLMSQWLFRLCWRKTLPDNYCSYL